MTSPVPTDYQPQHQPLEGLLERIARRINAIIFLFMGIRRHELPFTINVFSYFFLVITSFWILKSLKKQLFFRYHMDNGGLGLLGFHFSAAQAELLAKILNMVAAMIAVVIFSWLSHKLKREKLTWVLAGAFMAGFVLFSFSLTAITPLLTWVFYIFGDMFATVMVVAFFAFLNDSVSPLVAKRLYGPIGLGGVLGGVVGSTFIAVFIDSISVSGWMWICFVINAIIVMNASIAGLYAGKLHTIDETWIEHPTTLATTSNSLLDSAYMTMRSPYLFSIGAIVCLYEIVSSLVDFQFSSAFEHYFTASEIGARFAQVFAYSNVVAFCAQLFLTGLIMRRFGLTPALLLLPATEMACAVGFLKYPLPLTAGLLSTLDNGLSYSINQSAKEVLYIPTSREAKYKAKAFIDMFIQRFGKTVGVVISLIVTMRFTDFSSVRWISLLTFCIGFIWLNRAHYVGKEFVNLTSIKETRP